MLEESRFTRPTSRCPHPEWWHAPDADATEDEVSLFVAALVRCLQPEHVLETGTHTATTARLIGEALRTNGHGHLTTIELDGAKHRRATILLGDLPVRCIQGDSLVIPLDDLPPIDLAWFDSAGGDLRAREFERFLPRLAPGAVVGFHDIAPHHREIRAAVLDLEDRGLLRILDLRTPRGLALGQAGPRISS